MMKKLFLFLIAFVLLGFSMGLANSIEASSSVNITVNGIFDGSPEFTPVNTTGTRGGTYSYDGASTPSGHAFAFWIVNGVVRKDLAVDHVFTITSKMTLQIVFTPTSPSKYVAVFIDSNGAYIGREYTTGGAVSDASLTMPASRPGFVVDSESKWTSIEGSSSITNVTTNSVFVLNYKEDTIPLGAVTLNVSNGTSSATNPVPFNSLVTVTANAAPAEQVFVGWEENGVIVSYNPQYKFTALYNRTLTATYSSAVTPTSIINFGVIGVRKGYFSYSGQIELVTGRQVVEYGFIYHTSSEGSITLESEGVVVRQSSNRQLSTNEYITSFGSLNYRSIRAYAILDDQSIIYSVKTLLHYYEDFANSNATSTYANGSFIGNHGISWSYGHSRNEDNYAISGKGIMLRRASDSYIEFTVSNGVGVFEFQYRKAFTGQETRQLEVIVNSLVKYTGVAHTYTITQAEPEVFTVTITINQPGAVTIRVKNVQSTSTNRQTTVDNFKWTNYPG